MVIEKARLGYVAVARFGNERSGRFGDGFGKGLCHERLVERELLGPDFGIYKPLLDCVIMELAIHVREYFSHI